MLNLCVLEFVRNENGFFVAAQSAATACLRSYLKGRGVHSIASHRRHPAFSQRLGGGCAVHCGRWSGAGGQRGEQAAGQRPGLPHRPAGRPAHLPALRRLGFELPGGRDSDHHRRRSAGGNAGGAVGRRGGTAADGVLALRAAGHPAPRCGKVRHLVRTCAA